MEKNHLFYEILENLKVFLRTIYNNHSFQTPKKQDMPKNYKLIYLKSKDSKYNM